MKVRKTLRGFDIMQFVDRYGASCSLQKSSIATEDCIWLGVDSDLNNKDIEHGRMHLTPDMVAALIPHLKHFVKTGELS